MRVSAKADYAVRAAVELATQPPDVPVRADQISVSQDIPLRFLENILYEMRNNDLDREPTRGRRRLLADAARIRHHAR